MAKEIADIEVRLQATVAKFERDMRRASQAFDRQSSKIDRSSTRLAKKMGASFGAIAAKVALLGVAMVGVGKGIESVSRSGDRLRQLEARFSAMTDSAERGTTIMRNLVEMSLRTGVSIDALGVSFSRFTLAAKSINATDDQVRQFTENVIKMARISGTAGGELDGALRQLGQALGSGVLRGDELNSIFEAMPNLIEAVADEMGVTIGEIRELASEGKVVSDVVFQAILKKTEEIDEAIKKLPDSMATASGKMATAWQVFAAELDKTIGASQTLVTILTNAAVVLQGIQGVLENINAGGSGGAGLVTKLPGVPGAGALGDPTGLTDGGPAGTAAEKERMKYLLQYGERGLQVWQRRAAMDRFRANDATSIDKYMTTPGALPEQVNESPIPARRGMDAYLKFIEDNKPKGGGGGGGSRSGDDTARRMIASMKERLSLMKEDARLVGLSEEARVRLSAQFDRERMVRELLDAAARDGTTVTEQEIAQAKQVAEAIEAETLAMFAKEEAIDRMNDRIKEANREQERMADNIREVSDRLIGAVTSANSFTDALKRVGFELVSIAAQSITGSGPLGGVVNKSLGVASGGIISALFSAKGNVFNRGNVIPFAKGGVVNGATSFPMPNGMGIMGEAGPEAIMPLQRGPGGRLGVAASGGGGPVVNIYPQYSGVNGWVRAMIQEENTKLKGEIMRAIPGRASQGFRQQPGLRR